jgi:hypothetical protein
MTYEQRSSRDYFFGTLLNPAATSDTSVSSTAFTTLGTGYTTTQYLPVVLHDPSRGVYEMVWITGHTAASQSVTVLRGREGSSAQAWPGGTQLVVAPSIRDGLPALTRATLPIDPHLGMRALVADESVVVERTVAGWSPSVGVSNPADVGPLVNAGATFPPANAVILLRAAYATFVADGSGNGSIAYRTPFPNATIAVAILSNSYASVGPFVTYASDANGFSFSSYGPGSSARLAGGTNVAVCYIAVGY